jgi:sec-independent protein translocase protein TatA
MNIPFLFIGYGEVLLILIVILLLFGGKKVPELMRGLGKGVRSFKEGLNGLDEDEKKTTSRQETDDAGRTTSRQESDKEGKTE